MTVRLETQCPEARTGVAADGGHVVVAGGGNAGLCAALSARDRGADVIIVERSPRWRRGGNSRHTRDIRYAHDEADEWAPTPYPADVFLADLASVTNGSSNSELTRTVVERSRDLPRWMEEHGVRWQRQLRGTLHLETNRFFLGGGKAMMNAYYRAARAADIRILYGASVREIELEGARCVSVDVEADGRRDRLLTRALVVASGGLEANYDWLEQKWGTGARNFVVRGTPDNDGELLLKLLEAGAAQVGSDLFHCIAVDARAPKFDGGIVTRVDSVPFSVTVNKTGKRFYDEGEDWWPKRYAMWGQLIARQPDQLAYSIFDRNAHDLFIPSVFPPFAANSLDGLLAQLDIDRDQALRTIREFNAAVDESVPFDPTRKDGRATIGTEPRRTNWARKISSPPFYAFPLAPGVTFTYFGVRVDEQARVAKSDGSVFENVYAAGEVMAGNILTSGYLAGFGLTIGSVFGRIAGEEAANGH